MSDELKDTGFFSSLITHHLSSFYADSFRQTRKHRRHRSHAARSGGGEARAPSRRRVGFARAHLREPASRFLLTKTVDVPARTHVIRKNLTLAAGALGFDAPTDAEAFEFPVAVSRLHEREADEIVRMSGEEFAI